MKLLKKWWLWVLIGLILLNLCLVKISSYMCISRIPTDISSVWSYDLFGNIITHDFRVACEDLRYECKKIGPFYIKTNTSGYKNCISCYESAQSLGDRTQSTKELLRCEEQFRDTQDDWDVICADYFDVIEGESCDSIPDTIIPLQEDPDFNCRDMCKFIAAHSTKNFSDDYCRYGMTKRLRNDCYIEAARITKNATFCDKTTLSWFKTPVREFTFCFDLNTTGSVSYSYCGRLSRALTCRFEISESIGDCERFMLTESQTDLCYFKFIDSIEAKQVDSRFSCDDFKTEEGMFFCRETKKKKGRFSFSQR